MKNSYGYKIIISICIFAMLGQYHSVGSIYASTINLQASQGQPAIKSGIKYIYGNNGLLDYIHLPTGQFMKHNYDGNGNLLQKKNVAMSPTNSLAYNGNQVLELSSNGVNTAAGGKNTVEFWMYWDGTDAAMPFAWYPGYDLYIAGGMFGFNIFNGDIMGVPSATLKNRWVHVAAVFYNGEINPTNVELYIDGVKQTLKDFAATSSRRPVSVGNKVNIGGYAEGGANHYTFKGKLSNMRIWNTGLSAEQIQFNMYRKLAGNEQGLVGEWVLFESPIESKQFNGNQVLELSSNGVNTAAGGKNTVEFWMYWDGTEAAMPFAWYPGYDLYLASGMFGFNIFNGDIMGIPSASLKNRWVHVAAVFYNGEINPTNVELYIDGVKQTLRDFAPASSRRPVSVGNKVNIGGYAEGATNLYTFKGKLSNIRIWNTGLSAGQIQSSMYRKLAGNEQGLVGEWVLSDSPLESKPFIGDQVMELSSNGVNTAAGGKNTVEFWMYWDGTDVAMPFAWYPGYDLYIAGGMFGFNIFNGDIMGVPSVSLKNRWVHIAAVFYNGEITPTNVELYIDGVKQTLRDFAATSSKRPVSVGNKVNIGGYVEGGANHYTFKGKLSDLRIWNTGLSQSQIKFNIFKKLYGNETGLVMNWKVIDYGYILTEA
ncbi:LamG domain-containing protein [Paenibacillus sp. FSL H8-0537]|uniref:LamG domain-containing protein n=1 Tax=Paenibacillus sp. FSL H8-0537 TaxID=2921399 RepID=UPI00310171DC